MELQLESRSCVQCKRPFRVMMTSPTKACSALCMTEAGIKIPVRKAPPQIPKQRKSDFADVETFGKLLRPQPEASLPKVSQIESATRASPRPPTETRTEASIPERVNDSSHVLPTNKPDISHVLPTNATVLKVSQKCKQTVSEPHLLEDNVQCLLEVKQRKVEPSESEDLSEPDSLELTAEEKKFREYVQRAKACVSVMAKERLQIATLCIEVCDIHWGGGDHWKNYDGVHTVSRFAHETGISYKTLMNWVRTKRNVYDKLQGLIAISPVQDWAAMVRVADRCKSSDTPDQVLKKFQSWDKHRMKTYNQSRQILMGSRRIRSFAYFLENRADAKKIEAEDMVEVGAHCRKILKWVKQHEGDFK